VPALVCRFVETASTRVRGFDPFFVAEASQVRARERSGQPVLAAGGPLKNQLKLND